MAKVALRKLNLGLTNQLPPSTSQLPLNEQQHDDVVNGHPFGQLAAAHHSTFACSAAQSVERAQEYVWPWGSARTGAPCPPLRRSQRTGSHTPISSSSIAALIRHQYSQYWLVCG